MESDKTHPKRKYPRRDFESKVGVLLHGAYLVEKTIELGERGMMFETEIAFRQLQEIVVSFVIPLTGDVVITRAQVRYVVAKKGRVLVGVEFINISFEDRRKVRDFISQRTDKTAPADNGLF